MQIWLGDLEHCHAESRYSMRERVIMQMSMDRLRGDGGWRAPNVAGRRGPVTARDGVPAPSSPLGLAIQRFQTNAGRTKIGRANR